MNLIEEMGGKTLFVKCNVGNESDIINLIEKTISHFGRLDFAFNNAGIEGIAASTHECSRENWDKTIIINLTSVFLCMKYQIPHMLKEGGAIVNCASIAGLVGFEGLPAYVASKHAVVGITKSTALEYAKSNIRINAVCPGVIRTPMIDRFTGKNKEVEQAFIDQKPMGRLGEPEETEHDRGVKWKNDYSMRGSILPLKII